jgi:hypothetical protein
MNDKIRRMTLAGHVARRKEMRSAYKYRKPKGKGPLGNYGNKLSQYAYDYMKDDMKFEASKFYGAAKVQLLVYITLISLK